MAASVEAIFLSTRYSLAVERSCGPAILYDLGDYAARLAPLGHSLLLSSGAPVAPEPTPLTSTDERGAVCTRS
jgi:hypothetical protein